jgi:voltage-gated potassium channel
MRLRGWLHSQLAPEAWPKRGLSPVNRVVCALIACGGVFAIAETEQVVVDAAPLAFEAIEDVLAAIFTIEYAARIYAAGEDPRYGGACGRLRYLVTPVAIIDLLAIAPLYLTFVSSDTLLLRICRLLRIVRLAKLGRYSLAMRHLADAIRLRRYELGLSAGLAGLVLIGSATLMYLVEAEAQPAAFGSIPRALWWSITTLTTVGYGDVYPVTPIGRLLAGLTALTAIALIAMPTGILAAAFSDVFRAHKAKQAQAPPQRLKVSGD